MRFIASSRRIVRGIVRRKRQTALVLSAVLLGVYAAVFASASSAVSPADQRHIQADGRTIAFERWTIGTPRARVILIHGAPTDSSSWDTLREHLGELRDVEFIAVDRLGYGNSTHDTVASLHEHAASLATFIEGASLPVILVGHSYGGPVALRTACEHPDKVAGVVLVAGACDAYMNDAQWFRKAVNALEPLAHETWITANRELLALTDENRTIEPMLARIACPVTVLHGTWDPVCPYEGTTSYLTSRLSNAQQVTITPITRTGHNIHQSHPEVVAKAIAEQVSYLRKSQ